jgi:hypothetical protein
MQVISIQNTAVLGRSWVRSSSGAVLTREHLVQRPGAVPNSAAASQPQHPDCFDVAVASLRRAECITGERDSGGAHRVVAVGLA